MASKSKRDRIVALMQAGLRNKDVAKKLNVCPKTVYDIIKRYKMKRTLIDAKHVPRRESLIRTTTMMRIVKDDLGLKALKMQRRQLISAPTKNKRFDRGRKMLEEISIAGNKVFIWSDEKIFTVEAVSNS